MFTARILLYQSKGSSKINKQSTNESKKGSSFCWLAFIIGLLVPTYYFVCVVAVHPAFFSPFLPPVTMFFSVRVILPLTLSMFSSPLSLPPPPYTRQFQFSSTNQDRHPIPKCVPSSSVLPPLSSPALPSQSLLFLCVETEKCLYGPVLAKSCQNLQPTYLFLDCWDW